MNYKKILCFIFIPILLAGPARAGRHLSLEESRRLALQNNVRTANSFLETEAARETKRAAFTKYFPTISASGTVFEAGKPFMEITSEGGNLPVYDGNPANLPAATQFAYFPSSTMSLLSSMKMGMVTVVQPVFTGGRIVNGNRLAALGVDAGTDKERMARNEVLLGTEEQYWRVVSLNEKMRTVLKYEELLRRLLVQVEDAYNSGLAMKNDVLKVKLKLSEVMLNKSKIENGKAMAAMAFCQYIGTPYDPDIEFGDPLFIDGPPDSRHVDHQAALKDRPEFSLLETSVRAEELKTRLKLGEYLPQVGIGVAGLYMKMDETKWKSNGVLFGTLSIPLSGWWEASHTLGEQKARRQIARNNMKDHSDLLVLQMEKAWKDYSDTYKQVLLCRDARAQAEENLKVNQDGYDNGLINVSDLLEAQTLLQQANDQLTDAMADYRIKQVTYMQVTGR